MLHLIKHLKMTPDKKGKKKGIVRFEWSNRETVHQIELWFRV